MNRLEREGPVIVELSADVLELLRKDDEFLLYRNKPHLYSCWPLFPPDRRWKA
jgi:hypothetical protein